MRYDITYYYTHGKYAIEKHCVIKSNLILDTNNYKDKKEMFNLIAEQEENVYYTLIWDAHWEVFPKETSLKSYLPR
jgi:hypothetical protein